MGGISSGTARAGAGNGVPGPGAYSAKDLMDRHKIAPAIHPILQDPNSRKLDVGYENVRRFPELRKRTIHCQCRAGGYWCHDRSIPGPNWVPDSGLERRPITIRDRIPERGSMQDTPGPGTYNVPNEAMANSEPRFTMKGPAERDCGVLHGDETPGPGYYQIKVHNGLPQWTIGLRSLQRAAEQRAATSVAKMGLKRGVPYRAII
jgi:hypothetical protein